MQASSSSENQIDICGLQWQGGLFDEIPVSGRLVEGPCPLKLTCEITCFACLADPPGHGLLMVEAMLGYQHGVECIIPYQHGFSTKGVLCLLLSSPPSLYINT